MGILYNVRPIRSKELPYIDVLSESINNAIRFLIGWFAATSLFIPPVSIVLGYWMGGAFLMATKRFSEYRAIGDKTKASLYRKSFKYYDEKSLIISAVFYSLLSVFFCGIFLIKYCIELIIAIPFLCGLFCLYLIYLSRMIQQFKSLKKFGKKNF
jgi:4-hydroxybenzoate polyprenyltransferase